MRPTISDLLAAILDPNRKLSDVLRLALLVDACRNDMGFSQWVLQELNGYQFGPVPPHRLVWGQPYTGTPQSPGRVSFTAETLELREVLSTHQIRTPIGEIESFTTNPRLSVILVDLPQDAVEAFSRVTAFVGEPQMFLEISKPPVSSILEAVRTHLMLWAQEYDVRDSDSPPPAHVRESASALGAHDSARYSYTIIQTGPESQVQIGNLGVSPEILSGITALVREIKRAGPTSPEAKKWTDWLKGARGYLGPVYPFVRKIFNELWEWDLPE